MLFTKAIKEKFLSMAEKVRNTRPIDEKRLSKKKAAILKAQEHVEEIKKIWTDASLL